MTSRGRTNIKLYSSSMSTELKLMPVLEIIDNIPKYTAPLHVASNILISTPITSIEIIVAL